MHTKLHRMIDELNKTQAALVADYITGLLAEETNDQDPEEEEREGTHNGKVRGAGWTEYRMVNKWGPYEYHCSYGPDGRKRAKYIGKVRK